jgi:hypothetical protein
MEPPMSIDSTGNSSAPSKRIELHVPALAGHQPDALDAEHPGDRLELRPQRLELNVDQVRAVQVDGVAMLTAHLAARDVDAVLHQQVENVAQDADAVLAVHFDTHERPEEARAFLSHAQKVVKIC